MDRIGGWNAKGASPVGGAPAIAEKVAQANKQHIIYEMSASFSGTPGSPVALSIVCPDVSPNVVLWDGYVGGASPSEITFPAGICGPIGGGIEAVLAGSGSLVGKVNLHGNTR